MAEAERQMALIQKIVRAIKGIRAKYNIPVDKILDVSIKAPQRKKG